MGYMTKNKIEIVNLMFFGKVYDYRLKIAIIGYT